MSELPSVPRPWSTRRFVVFTGGRRSRRVVLAVRPIDAVTGSPPQVPLEVFLDQRPELEPVATAGGYVCFLRREREGEPPPPPERVTLRVECDPLRQDHYFPVRLPIVLPMLDERDPVQEIRLMPKPTYPFPGTATLVRGSVLRPGKVAVVGVRIESSYLKSYLEDGEKKEKPAAVETITDRRGQFVLFFPRTAKQSQEIEVRAHPPGPPLEPHTVTLVEGKSYDRAHFQLT